MWRLFRRAKPPQPEPPITKPLLLEAPLPPRVEAPIPLVRVLPPLSEADQAEAVGLPNGFSAEEITTALALLRGGVKRDPTHRHRATRPARFQIAARHVRDYAESCLLLRPDEETSTSSVFAGYLVWAMDAGLAPVGKADFEFAMGEHLAYAGGVRLAQAYRGCCLRPAFHNRCEAVRKAELEKRMRMGLEELITERR